MLRQVGQRIDPVPQHLSRLQPHQPGQHAEQGRFPGAVGTKQEQRSPGFHLKRDILQYQPFPAERRHTIRLEHRVLPTFRRGRLWTIPGHCD